MSHRLFCFFLFTVFSIHLKAESLVDSLSSLDKVSRSLYGEEVPSRLCGYNGKYRIGNYLAGFMFACRAENFGDVRFVPSIYKDYIFKIDGIESEHLESAGPEGPGTKYLSYHFQAKKWKGDDPSELEKLNEEKKRYSKELSRTVGNLKKSKGFQKNINQYLSNTEYYIEEIAKLVLKDLLFKKKLHSTLLEGDKRANIEEMAKAFKTLLWLESKWTHFRESTVKGRKGQLDMVVGDRIGQEMMAYGMGQIHTGFHPEHFQSYVDPTRNVSKAAKMFFKRWVDMITKGYVRYGRGTNDICPLPDNFLDLAGRIYASYNGGRKKICREGHGNDKNYRKYLERTLSEEKPWSKYLTKKLPAPELPFNRLCFQAGGTKCQVAGPLELEEDFDKVLFRLENKEREATHWLQTKVCTSVKELTDQHNIYCSSQENSKMLALLNPSLVSDNFSLRLSDQGFLKRFSDFKIYNLEKQKKRGLIPLLRMNKRYQNLQNLGSIVRVEYPDNLPIKFRKAASVKSKPVSYAKSVGSFYYFQVLDFYVAKEAGLYRLFYKVAHQNNFGELEFYYVFGGRLNSKEGDPWDTDKVSRQVKAQEAIDFGVANFLVPTSELLNLGYGFVIGEKAVDLKAEQRGIRGEQWKRGTLVTQQNGESYTLKIDPLSKKIKGIVRLENSDSISSYKFELGSVGFKGEHSEILSSPDLILKSLKLIFPGEGE